MRFGEGHRTARSSAAAGLAIAAACFASVAAGPVSAASVETAVAKAAPPCPLVAIGTVAVAAVMDGRTARLADGRELRLAAIEIPPETKNAEAARAARQALAALIEGREVVVQRIGPGADRYGRLVAHAFVSSTSGEPPRWVQETLLAQGFARVAAQVGDSTCAAVLLAAEATARDGGLGLWAHSHYLVRHAETPREILAERGRFAVVEGKVVSVRESGGIIYVNFGRRWSDDFTVTVPKRRERAFAAAGLELRKLAGRRVRIRGYVEERGGPWIEAMSPEQIEVAGRD